MHVAESSSAHPTVKRRRRDGTQVEVACPSVLPDYQAYMRGVDRGDQLQTYYNIGRRSTKWWERVVFLYCRMCYFEQLYFGWAHSKC